MKHVSYARYYYLIISYGKPHKPVSSEIISRWIKDELSKAGVDNLVVKAHSCRSASSNKARDAGMSVSEILKKGGRKSVHTFKIFYSRDITNSEDLDFEFNYISPILDSKCFENEIIFSNLIELMNLRVYMHQFI